MKTAFAVIA